MRTGSTAAAISTAAELATFLIPAHSQNYSDDKRNENYKHYYCTDIFSKPCCHYKHPFCNYFVPTVSFSAGL